MMLSLFVLGCFAAATSLYAHSPDRIWWPLLHNGLLLPSQLVLLYLCALLPTPQSSWLRRNLPRLGASSLSIFALHVPLFSLWTTLEPLLRSVVADRHGNWQEWVKMAGETMPSLIGYAAFILCVVGLCVHFQEQFVSKLRKIILKQVLRPAT